MLWSGKGIKWEFQKPIGPFFADFAIPLSKVIIEADGGYHLDTMQMHRDASRTEYLESNGWKVLRFTNDEIMGQLASVVIAISNEIGVKA